MEPSKEHFMSRRGFCLCCIGGAAAGNERLAHAAGGLRGGAWHRQPDQGQRGGLADRHAQAAQQYQRPRGLRRKRRRTDGPRRQGADRAGIGVSQPQMTKALAELGADPDHAPDQYALALRSYRRQYMAACGGRQDHRPREHPQIPFRGSARRGMGLQLPPVATRRNSQRSLCH